MTTQDCPPYLIAGLGNPGRSYRNTRHNVGFMTVDHLARAWGLTFDKRRANSLIAQVRLGQKKVILAKPQTQMNLSGRAVASVLRFFKVPHNQLLVIEDDLDLPMGRLRLRASGGTGGHKGLRSIQEQLGTERYARLRIGIGRPPGNMDPVEYVLREFREEEGDHLERIIAAAAECVLVFLDRGIEAAMTHCSGTVS